MSNSEKYHFQDFTWQNYRHLLKLAKKSYHFRTFLNYKPGERFIIWRHDVDFSMEVALELARIEADEGVKSTYFLLLHSQFYNLLEKETAEKVFEIMSLGHDIGLHFDSHFFDIKDHNELDHFLIFEKNLLGEIFRTEIQTFSFHKTTPFTIGCDQSTYSGMINAFSAYFQKEAGYCSDSNCYWRFRRLEEVLTTADDHCLQVLTHPECWSSKVTSPKERVLNCLKEHNDLAWNWYVDTLKSYDRENIDWN